MSATGINDLGMLVKTFISTEEKNFALFKFVNEMNQEWKSEKQLSTDHIKRALCDTVVPFEYIPVPELEMKERELAR